MKIKFIKQIKMLTEMEDVKDMILKVNSFGCRKRSGSHKVTGAAQDVPGYVGIRIYVKWQKNVDDSGERL